MALELTAQGQSVAGICLLWDRMVSFVSARQLSLSFDVFGV
jgi:hypothetical protein